MQARLKLWGLAAIGVAAIGCSSGGGGSEGTGTGGAGGQGQAGASAGSSGGTSSSGTGGQTTAGSGGAQGGTSGAAGAGGVAGAAGNTSAGAAGAGGSGGSAGTSGQAGSAGGAGGRGGSGGSSGSSGSGGSGARGGTSGSAGAGGSGTGGGGSGGANGGRGGGSGGSGGAGGGVASAVTPTKNGNRYRFAWGDVILEIDAAAGGRVATLSLAGADIIVPVPTANDPTTYGSVFWTSPRSSWPGTMWPPPVMIDGAMYSGGINGTHVVLDGPADTTLGVSMSKDYSADATTGWIKIAYTIHATKAQKAAPWEVSRVPRGGIVFFPLGSSITAGPLTITQQSTTPKTVWFDDAPKTATSPTGEKLFADGSGGWEAYVLNGNLFLKRFADVPANMQPSGEGEIDVYPGAGFLEYEEQGAYTQLTAPSTTNWSVEWKVVKVPSTVSIAVSSNALLDFAKQQVAQ